MIPMQTHTTSFSESIPAIAETFGTPLYIYNGDELVSNYWGLKNCLPPFVDVFYALKVNPNISLVGRLRQEGACAEVCSLIELEIALQAGVPPQDIIFLGPAKRDAEIRRALELGIFALVVESETELKRVSRMAGEMKTTAHVAIRINPSFVVEDAPLKMGGRATQFGISEATVFDHFAEYLSLPNLHIRGIHIYNGTRILSAKAIFENTRNILELFRKLCAQFGSVFSMVDVGGGMGIPYFANDKELDRVEMENLMKPLFEAFHQEFPRVRIIMESGRYIAGTAGVFVSKINNIKSNYGETYLITDGGTHCHMSATGIGSVVRRNFPMENLTATVDAEPQRYQVAGPLCNPDDLTGRNIQLPEATTGDLIAITASGAYGPTASPVLFHSQGHPAEVMVIQGVPHLIRERDEAKDLIARHVLLDFDSILSEPDAQAIH